MTEIAPNTRGGGGGGGVMVKFWEIHFILLKIAKILILSEREKMLKFSGNQPTSIRGPCLVLIVTVTLNSLNTV